MLAKRIPTILPDLSFEESLEITKIHSIAGNLPVDMPLILNRPFQVPHHTITKTSLVGGGKIPKPGEISLAHLGVLFLDELPEFNQTVIEALRGPLEDKSITISRLQASFTYPSNFMLVATMNPCMCGYYGVEGGRCKCSKQAISKYIRKVSGPLIDRIDIQVEVNPVLYSHLNSSSYCEHSHTIQKRVNQARQIQLQRYQKSKLFSNSELSPKLIEQYCKLDVKTKRILETAFEQLGLSVRAYTRVLKVARTIADLEQKEQIESKHILEAIQYRSLDKKYWQNK